MYGSQAEEVQSDAFQVFQRFDQGERLRLRPWANGVEVDSRRRFVALAGSPGLGTALAEGSCLVAFDASYTQCRDSHVSKGADDEVH